MHAPPTSLLADGRHHLLVIGDRDATDAVKRCAELAKRYLEGQVVHLAGRTAPRGIATWSDEGAVARRTDGAPTAVLIRPDGHLGFTGSLEHTIDLAAHLDRWFTHA